MSVFFTFLCVCRSLKFLKFFEIKKIFLKNTLFCGVLSSIFLLYRKYSLNNRFLYLTIIEYILKYHFVKTTKIS